MEERYYAPKYSVLAKELEIATLDRKSLIKEAENKYEEKLKDIRKRCKAKGHKYDDGISALVEVRYGYNDYRYKCQICGAEIRRR